MTEWVITFFLIWVSPWENRAKLGDKQKSVGREESRITVLNKILMTQKKTNIFIFLQLVAVPQAKLQILEK